MGKGEASFHIHLKRNWQNNNFSAYKQLHLFKGSLSLCFYCEWDKRQGEKEKLWHCVVKMTHSKQFADYFFQIQKSNIKIKWKDWKRHHFLSIDRWNNGNRGGSSISPESYVTVAQYVSLKYKIPIVSYTMTFKPTNTHVGTHMHRNQEFLLLPQNGRMLKI